MLQTVRITSKRQITIPALVYNKLRLKKGQRLIVQEKENKIIMEPEEALVEELAGSLSLPKRFQGKSIQQIIKQAKTEYFSSHR